MKYPLLTKDLQLISLLVWNVGINDESVSIQENNDPSSDPASILSLGRNNRPTGGTSYKRERATWEATRVKIHPAITLPLTGEYRIAMSNAHSI